MKVLLTGGTGLIGREVVNHLRAEPSIITICTSRRGDGNSVAKGDLLDRYEVRAMLRAIKPDCIVHLAGGVTQDVWRDNVEATDNLLSSLALTQSRARIVLAGSSAEYGGAAVGERIHEDAFVRPITEYGRAKAMQVMRARAFAAEHGSDLVVIRPFQVVAPEMPRSSAVGNALAQMSQSSRSVVNLALGRTSIVRDFVPASFVARAVVGLVISPQLQGTYNICSGHGRTVLELVDAIAARLGLETKIKDDLELMSLVGPASMVGDPTNLQRDLGLLSQPSLEDLAAYLTNTSRKRDNDD